MQNLNILHKILSLILISGQVLPHYFPHHQYFAHHHAQTFFQNSAGFGFSPNPPEYPQFSVPAPNWLGGPSVPINYIPTELKATSVGWDTIYNVPCGSYTIHPFVIAYTRYQSGNGIGNHYHRKKRSFYPKLDYQRGKEASCSWEFQAFGSCKLIFKCTWFQLPALFKCEENFMDLTDQGTLGYRFCGNRKPKGPYVTTTTTMKLTFKSERSLLPTVFDCAVSCSLEALYASNTNNKNVSAQVSQSSTSGVASASSSVVDSVTRAPERKKPSSTPTPQKAKYVSCKCGKGGDLPSASRIVGGTHTFSGEYPWVAALVKKNNNQAFCGGSLINDRYVLTAGHCVQRWQGEIDSIEVILNQHDLTLSNNTIRIRIKRIIIHPKYDNSSYDHDIALLQLDQIIQIQDSNTSSSGKNNDSISETNTSREMRSEKFIISSTPICLPAEKITRNAKDQHAIVTGWGLTKEGGIPSKTLMQAAVEIFNDTSCKQCYEGKSHITDQMICAGHLQGKMDSCVGDSGGGLIIDEYGKYVLKGIVSFGKGCARPNLPGVYTRVEGLTHWIRSNTEEDSFWCDE